MKKVVDLVYFLLSFLSLFLMAGSLALAAAPAAFLLQTAWRMADPGRPWLSALRLSSAVGAGFVLFIPGLMLLTVLLRNLFWLRNREGRGVSTSWRPSGQPFIISCSTSTGCSPCLLCAAHP